MPDTTQNEQALRKLQQSAENGDAQAQYRLAVLYHKGQGVPKDYGQAASWYLKAAEQGHAKAQLYLGLMYRNGRGVEQDHTQAAQWFMKSAVQGEGKAQYYLGVSFCMGTGVLKDYATGAVWLNRSARQGNSDAENMLQKMLDVPNVGAYLALEAAEEDIDIASLPAEEREAVALRLNNSAKLGNVKAEILLDEILRVPSAMECIDLEEADATTAHHVEQQVLDEEHSEPDDNAHSTGDNKLFIISAVVTAAVALFILVIYYKSPSEKLIDRAERGDVNAQATLATNYYRGIGGFKVNLRRALYWARRAADRENITAMYILGHMYEGGRDIIEVAQDYREALYWYNKVIEQKPHNKTERNIRVDAQFAVARIQEDMNSSRPSTSERPAQTTQQPSSSASTYTSDADNLYQLGVQNMDSKNYTEALRYYRQAADKNYSPAQDKLGWMYQNGWGVRQDYSQALSWYLKAANQGNNLSQASVGLMYYKGLGVARDYDKALDWYRRSAAQGNKTAEKRCAIIERLKQERPFIEKQANVKNGLPFPGFITDNKTSVRSDPAMQAKAKVRLNSGHPVSIYRTREADSEFWYYARTASGTEGWVLASYTSLSKNLVRSDQERTNRNYTLPAQGTVLTDVSDFLNIRNIPSLTGSKVVGRADRYENVTVLEIFAEEERDWYKVRTSDYVEGWASGKYVRISGY